MEHHAQYIDWEELTGRDGSLLGHRSAGGEQLHCASLVGFFFPLPPLPFLLYSFSLLLLLLYFIITIVSIIFYFNY